MIERHCRCGWLRSRQDGWTRRSDGVWVCARCMRPSEATALRVALVHQSVEVALRD